MGRDAWASPSEENPLDPRTRLFLWVLAAEASFAALFAAFGAVSGALRWREGRPAGTRFGFGVARAFDRIRGVEHTPTVQGALIGGADGAAFGLVVGTVVGFVVAWRVPAEWELFRPILVTVGALVACAAAFGLFAGLMVFLGTRATLGLFVGGVGGALLGFWLRGLDGLMVGAIAGAVVGALLSPRTGRPRGP
jgi:hypothetical protein